MAEFKSVFTASPTRPRYQSNSPSAFTNMIKDVFSLSSLLLIGAVFQVALALILPLRLAVAPAVLLAIFRAVQTSLQAARVIPHEFEKDAIPGKTSAQLPNFPDSTKAGRFGPTAASESLVVFLLGARINHPLSILAPGAKEIGDYASAMYKNLAEDAASASHLRSKYGMLGMSTWTGTERERNNTIMTLMYFRDVDGLNAFAQSDVHRAGWKWYDSGKFCHIGIMHETYVVPKGAYETVFGNYHPSHLAAAVTQLSPPDGKEGEAPSWVQPMVLANKGILRTQFGRMARSSGQEHEIYGDGPAWHSGD